MENNLNFNDWIERFENLQCHWESNVIQEGWIAGKTYLKDANFLSEPLNKIGEPSAVIIKKECFDKVGYFRQDLKQVLDFEFYYRIMPFYNIAYIDQKLISFRLHYNKESVRNSNIKIRDYDLLPEIYYSNLSKYFSLKNRFSLAKKYNRYLRFLFKIMNKLNFMS